MAYAYDDGVQVRTIHESEMTEDEYVEMRLHRRRQCYDEIIKKRPDLDGVCSEEEFCGTVRKHFRRKYGENYIPKRRRPQSYADLCGPQADKKIVSVVSALPGIRHIMCGCTRCGAPLVSREKKVCGLCSIEMEVEETTNK